MLQTVITLSLQRVSDHLLPPPLHTLLRQHLGSRRGRLIALNPSLPCANPLPSPRSAYAARTITGRRVANRRSNTHHRLHRGRTRAHAASTFPAEHLSHLNSQEGRYRRFWSFWSCSDLGATCMHLYEFVSRPGGHVNASTITYH